MKKVRKGDFSEMKSFLGTKITIKICGKKVQRILRENAYGLYVKFNHEHVQVQLNTNQEGEIIQGSFTVIDSSEQEYVSNIEPSTEPTTSKWNVYISTNVPCKKVNPTLIISNTNKHMYRNQKRQMQFICLTRISLIRRVKTFPMISFSGIPP